jgi:hypothetical protein
MMTVSCCAASASRIQLYRRAQRAYGRRPAAASSPGELPLAALRRELHEETGLVIDADPPHVWHQEVGAPRHADGYDGLVNDYFLVRTTRFDPPGACPMTTSPPSTSAGCDGGGTETSPNTAEPTCSHPVTSPHR